MTFGGTATAGIAVVTAAALILPTAYAGPGDATSDGVCGPAAGDTEPIDYTLPELDPGESHAWRVDDATENGMTKALNDIVIDYIEDAYPVTVGWDTEARPDNGDAWVPTNPRGDLEPFKFHLYDAELTASDKLGNPHAPLYTPNRETGPAESTQPS